MFSPEHFTLNARRVERKKVCKKECKMQEDARSENHQQNLFVQWGYYIFVDYLVSRTISFTIKENFRCSQHIRSLALLLNSASPTVYLILLHNSSKNPFNILYGVFS